MKKILMAGLLVTGTVLIGTRGLEAAEATIGTDVASAYVWRGITFNDKIVAQPYLDVVHPSGLGLNIWGNYDMRDTDIDGDGEHDVNGEDFQEIDITASYALPVEVVDLSVGAIEYTFPGGGPSTLELYTSASKDLGDFFSVGLDAYYDVDEVEDYYLSASVGTSLALLDLLEIDLAGSIGYAGKDMAAGGEEGFHDYNLSASTAIPISNGVELGAFVAYTDSVDEDVLPSQEVDIYGGVGIHHAF